MKRFTSVLLMVSLLLTLSGCRQKATPPAAADTQEGSARDLPSLSIDSVPVPAVEPSSMEKASVSVQAVDTDIPPDEPQAESSAAEAAHPGRPVYVETREWLDMQRAQEENPEDSIPADLRVRATEFSHFEDPPKEGTVRLVYFSYDIGGVVEIDDPAGVASILDIVDAFIPSDYSDGPLSGGYGVEIQLVRDGEHQLYSVISGPYNGGYLVGNGRGPQWSITSGEGFRYLLRYFRDTMELLGNPFPTLSITLDIPQLAPGEVLFFGPYTVNKGDTITRTLHTQNPGKLFCGFSETHDNTISYWTQGNLDSNRSIEHQMAVDAAFEGRYYLWIGNSGDETLKNLQGSVEIGPLK